MSLFLLLICAIILGILSLLIGMLCCFWGKRYAGRKNVKIRLWAWALAPEVILFSFAAVFFVENLAYGIVTDTDPGIGDYRCVNINKKYHLYYINSSPWSIGERDDKEPLFGRVKEILPQEDTIAFTRSIYNRETKTQYYCLTQLNADKVEYATIDSAATTDVLWDKYTQSRNIDKADVQTCQKFYWKSRWPFFFGFAILDLLIVIYLIRKFWRRVLLIEDRQSA